MAKKIVAAVLIVVLTITQIAYAGADTLRPASTAAVISPQYVYQYNGSNSYADDLKQKRRGILFKHSEQCFAYIQFELSNIFHTRNNGIAAAISNSLVRSLKQLYKLLTPTTATVIVIAAIITVVLGGPAPIILLAAVISLLFTYAALFFANLYKEIKFLSEMRKLLSYMKNCNGQLDEVMSDFDRLHYRLDCVQSGVEILIAEQNRQEHITPEHIQQMMGEAQQSIEIEKLIITDIDRIMTELKRLPSPIVLSQARPLKPKEISMQLQSLLKDMAAIEQKIDDELAILETTFPDLSEDKPILVVLGILRKFPESRISSSDLLEDYIKRTNDTELSELEMRQILGYLSQPGISLVKRIESEETDAPHPIIGVMQKQIAILGALRRVISKFSNGALTPAPVRYPPLKPARPILPSPQLLLDQAA